MYAGNTLELKALENGIVELCFNRRHESVNKFDCLTLSELGTAIELLQTHDDLKGVLVTSAKDSFIVGADIFEFVEFFQLESARLAALIHANSHAFTEFSDLHVPSVAAINGFALGGGLEMALACDYRVMSSKARVGLPEVTLGIIPAYGGTVRLTRLAGAATAARWISSGSAQTAESALKAGAVDAVASPEALRQTALEWLQNAVQSGLDWQGRRISSKGPTIVETEALSTIRESSTRVARHAPAALAAVDLITESARLDRDAALKSENEAFTRLAKTPIAAALVGLFLCDQALKRKSRQLVKIARPIQQAAVLGAGIMGGGIAYQTCVSGIPVILKDIAQAPIDLGLNEAGKLLGKQVSTGRMSQDKADGLLASIRPTLDYSGFDKINIVVEAVVENLAVKLKVLGEVESHLPVNGVIATNTSSLSIADLSGALKQPENLVGLHFFNPVPVMPLVEVIRGPKTSDEAVATAVSYAQSIGKTPVVVADCPGFLVNRILICNFLGFLHLIRDGADFEQVDRTMESFGWPMGPAYLQDVVGMDTSRHVLETIIAGYPERMIKDYKDALTLMVENSRFGQKNGIGFYRYETDPKGKPRKLPAGDTHALLTQIQPHGSKTFSDEEIIERMMLPMVVDAAHCLETGIVETAGEIDLCMILGLGFPRHLGGILRYADQLGLGRVIASCERLAHLGPLYKPTRRMKEMAASSKKFFD